MLTYTIITAAGRKTKMDGVLAHVIESQKGRKTSVGIYLGSLLICVVCEGEVTMAL